MAGSVRLKVHAAFAPTARPANVQHCLDLHKQIIFTSGLWLSEPHQNLRYNGHLHVLERLALAVGALIVLSQLVDSTSNLSNMEFLTENLYVSIIFSMAIVKVLTVMQKPAAIKRLIGRLEAMKRDDRVALPEEQRIFAQHRTVAYRLTLAFCLVCGVTSSGFSLIPVADNTPNATARILPFRMWTPFNHTTTPTYEAMYTAVSVMAVWAGSAISVFDTLFVGMMLATIGQLKILQYKLANLRAIASGNIAREGPGRRRLAPEGRQEDDPSPPSPVQVIVTPGTGLYRRLKPATYGRVVEDGRSRRPAGKTKDSNAPFGDRVHWCTQRAGKRLDVQPSQASGCTRMANDVDREMQRFLGECVEHHVAILEFIDDLEDVFWGALVFQIFTSLAICVVVYQVTQAPGMNVKVVVMLLVIFAGVIQLFLYCWFSTVITHESYNLNEAMYYTDWLDCSPSLKRSMQIVMCRTEQCPQLRVAGFVPLSLVMFRRVLKQTYSMYSLITGLDSGIAVAINDLGI